MCRGKLLADYRKTKTGKLVDWLYKTNIHQILVSYFFKDNLKILMNAWMGLQILLCTEWLKAFCANRSCLDYFEVECNVWIRTILYVGGVLPILNNLNDKFKFTWREDVALQFVSNKSQFWLWLNLYSKPKGQRVI